MHFAGIYERGQTCFEIKITFNKFRKMKQHNNSELSFLYRYV